MAERPYLIGNPLQIAVAEVNDRIMSIDEMKRRCLLQLSMAVAKACCSCPSAETKYDRDFVRDQLRVRVACTAPRCEAAGRDSRGRPLDIIDWSGDFLKWTDADLKAALGQDDDSSSGYVPTTEGMGYW